MKTFAWKTSASAKGQRCETLHDIRCGHGGGGADEARTVVGLGGDEDSGDEQTVDVVVRRAERGPVLLAKAPEVRQSHQEA